MLILSTVLYEHFIIKEKRMRLKNYILNNIEKEF
jgi:hypothetical protein